jgi:hypothetical protein
MISELFLREAKPSPAGLYSPAEPPTECFENHAEGSMMGVQRINLQRIVYKAEFRVCVETGVCARASSRMVWPA